jgi:broad specificity phosphatase PhoE
MRTWYLVRHGETEWNAVRRMQGQLDSVLTPEGRAHASANGELLARLGVDAVYASPLGRVRESLDLMAAHVPLAKSAIFDDRLMEWSGGDWDGFYYAEVVQRWPAEFAAWEADRHNVRAPGGENFIDLHDRASAFLADIAHAPGPRIAIVAHGFLNRALAACLTGCDASTVMDIRQANDTVMRIRTDASGARHVDHFIAGAGPHAGLPGAASLPPQVVA